MPKARIKSKLPIEIVVRADERHHTSVRKPRTHAYRRASEAPVSARAVAVIQPVPIIIALPLFLCTLSGKRQLHACQDLLTLPGSRKQFGELGGIVGPARQDLCVMNDPVLVHLVEGIRLSVVRLVVVQICLISNQ